MANSLEETKKQVRDFFKVSEEVILDQIELLYNNPIKESRNIVAFVLQLKKTTVDDLPRIEVAQEVLTNNK
ncbi:MAG: hypothetical protein AB1775_03525 [Bacteroidota bacterium]